MRLAIVTQKVVRGDGQGRVNFEVAQAAARLGWQVTLLTSAVEPELNALSNVKHVVVPWSTRYTTLAAEFRFAGLSGQWLRRHRAEFDLRSDSIRFWLRGECAQDDRPVAAVTARTRARGSRNSHRSIGHDGSTPGPRTAPARARVRQG